ncbi:hypothetical protein ACFST9_10705 [Hymenobacter monticola]|nr:hypothetical protein [Hymenobacter monticola]
MKLVAAQFPRNEARDADCLRLGLLKAPAKATKTEKNAKANA